MPDADAPLLDKSALRRQLRARLAAELGDRDAKSAAICAALLRHPAYRQARTVALFDAMASEPDLGPLWGGKEEGRRFVYPRVEGERLVLIEVPDRSALVPAGPGFRFREPALIPERIVDPAAVDLVLTPGLAFTRAGLRLGRGGGFYDRLLASLSPHTAKLGVCFELQIVSAIPTEPHDLPLDAVITEAS